ncbi:MAG: TIGR03032 family protein, partial [Chloroflexi bacterium]|nr:TIGR03032 family protein [Chloroflexota bacterium]
GRYLYAALREPAGLLVLDRKDLSLLNCHWLEGARDAHSLCLHNGSVFLVSTGTDEVIRLKMNGPEVAAADVFWRPDPAAEKADLHHLNSICSWQGDLYVSGFGEKTGERWASARGGFVLNISAGYSVATGLFHPHSLLPTEDGIAFCESPAGAVRLSGGPVLQSLPGYIRGLCRSEGRLFVGASACRHRSRSAGVILAPEARLSSGEGTDHRGGCAVYRLAEESLEVEQTISLETFGDEIYDLLPVEDTRCWPLSPRSENGFMPELEIIS